MGFSLLESEHEVDGVPVALAYDVTGEDRVLFSERLDSADHSAGDEE